jgi:hypothetical protein
MEINQDVRSVWKAQELSSLSQSSGDQRWIKWLCFWKWLELTSLIEKRWLEWKKAHKFKKNIVDEKKRIGFEEKNVDSSWVSIVLCESFVDSRLISSLSSQSGFWFEEVIIRLLISAFQCWNDLHLHFEDQERILSRQFNLSRLFSLVISEGLLVLSDSFGLFWTDHIIMLTIQFSTLWVGIICISISKIGITLRVINSIWACSFLCEQTCLLTQAWPSQKSSFLIIVCQFMKIVDRGSEGVIAIFTDSWTDSLLSAYIGNLWFSQSQSILTIRESHHDQQIK